MFSSPTPCSSAGVSVIGICSPFSCVVSVPSAHTRSMVDGRELWILVPSAFYILALKTNTKRASGPFFSSKNLSRSFVRLPLSSVLATAQAVSHFSISLKDCISGRRLLILNLLKLFIKQDLYISWTTLVLAPFASGI